MLNILIPAFVGYKLYGMVVDRYMKCCIDEPKLGSILYCDVALGLAEHSGIYAGSNRVIHLNKKGVIENVSVEGFRSLSLNRNIYVSCLNKRPVGSAGALDNAYKFHAIYKRRDYNFILDNCHQFTSACLTGDIDNADNFLWMLKHSAENNLNINTWRVWDI